MKYIFFGKLTTELSVDTIGESLALVQKHYHAGRLREAEAICQRILQQEPDQADALHLLGVVAHRSSDYEKAIAFYTRALGVRQSEATFHINLALAFSALGRLPEASAHFQQALRLRPNDPDCRVALANVLQELGDLQGSLPHYREALRLQPEHFPAHYNLGVVLLELGKIPDAVAHGKKAVRLNPNSAEAYTSLGAALGEQGLTVDAIAHQRQALRLRPGYDHAHFRLASALVEQGKIEEAVSYCQETLRLNPDFGTAYALLGELAVHGSYSITGSEFQRMHALLSGGRLPLVDASRLHFAVAALLDRQAEYGRAFVHCKLGNELKQEIYRRRGQAFDRQDHCRAIDRTIATFDARFFGRVHSFGVDSDLPVFIVGMPRSGTTLVTQILSSLPGVCGAGELKDLAEVLAGPAKRQKLAADYPEYMSNMDRVTIRGMADDYLTRLRQIGGHAIRVIDKLPHNFFHLGSICALFARARIIHCRRDPLDVCLSCYFQDFQEVSYASKLEDLGFCYRQYERLMVHWRQVLPVAVCEVVYEELVANLEPVSRKLAAFCGLDWNSRCLAFHDNSRTVRTASKLQVRRPLYATSIGRWKHYESYLQPLHEALAR